MLTLIGIVADSFDTFTSMSRSSSTFEEAAFTPLVRLIYMASEDPIHWPDFLRAAARASRASAILMGRCYGLGREVQVDFSHGLEPRHVRSYSLHYGQNNPRTKALYSRGTVRRRQIFLSHDLCSDKDVFASSYYFDWLEPQGLFHSLTAIVRLEGEVVRVILVMWRSRKAGKFGKKEAALWRRLLPQLRRALHLAHRLGRAEAERNAAMGVLDRAPMGVILLDGHGAVVHVNPAAQDVLDQKDGLFICSKGIRASERSQSASLEKIIRKAALIRGDVQSHEDWFLSISRPSFRRPLLVVVTPLRGKPSYPSESRVAVALFVCDTDAAEGVSEEALLRFYGLTHAEAAVAMMLLSGKSVKEACDTLHISLPTARTHVSRILEKTTTRRQGELVRLLLRSPVVYRHGTRNQHP